MCGKPIPLKDSDALGEYKRSLRSKPTMSEAAWRKAGFKIMPTREQMGRPGRGCCTECGIKLIKLKYRQIVGYSLIGACVVVLFGVWATISLYMTQ